MERPKKRHLLRRLVFAVTTIVGLLRRLRVEEKPKKRHFLRNTAFAGIMVAAAALVAVVAGWRRGRRNAAAEPSSSQEPKTPDAEPGWKVELTGADATHDMAIPVPT